MKSDPRIAFLRVVVAAAAIGLIAPACGSRPIASDGGRDAATAGTSGGAGKGGASGGAGNGGAGNGGASGGAGSVGSGGGGNATAGSAGTSGIAGATGGAGSGGTAGSGASGGRGGSASGGSNGGASGGRGGSASGGSNGGASGGRGGSASGGSNGGAAGGRGGAAGGRAGAGGTGVPGPECATASDCKLVSDCCSCEAVPVGATVAACPPSCQVGQCEARQLSASAVACVAGRCVAGFACDSTNVTCRAAAPTCAAGLVPVVNDAGTCYLGTCAPASECTSVAGCGSCTGANEACVTYETQLGNQHHCVVIPPECNGAATCGCLGAASCLSPYRSCQEYSGVKGVLCSCPNC